MASVAGRVMRKAPRSIVPSKMAWGFIQVTMQALETVWPRGNWLVFEGQRIRDLADHIIGHVEDEQRACAQDDHFEPGKMIQQRADAIKAAQRQADVEEKDDERRRDGAAQRMG